MTSSNDSADLVGRLAAIVVDVAEFEPAEYFWTAALDYEVTNRGTQYVILRPMGRNGQAVTLQRVPERKTAKNRVHIALWVDGDLEPAVRRVEELGGSRVRFVDDEDWWIVTDPDGNELCLIPARDKPRQ